MSWQLVTTAPNAEARVERMLSHLAFDNRLYRMRRKMVCRGRVIDRLVPLFPRYIFVRAVQRWDLIRGLIGVIDFVRWGKEIITVSAQDFDKLTESADASYVVHGVEALHEKFRIGDAVRVAGMNSLVFGVEGVYQHSVGVDRAYVLLPWFNGQLVGTVVDERLLEHDYSRSHRKRHRGRNRSRRRDRNGSTLLLSPVQH